MLTHSPDDVARLTDAYFLKTKEVVRRFGDIPATYAIFLRRPVICTPRLMLEFLERMQPLIDHSLDVTRARPLG